MIALLLLVILTSATPRPAYDSPGASTSDAPRAVGVPSPGLAGAPHDVPQVGGVAPLATAGELSGAPLRGTATWYCGSGSPCTRGYQPGDLVAAIDRKDAPYRKGDRVVVSHRGRSVTVTIVDVCGCPGRRVIDLSAEAFSRLAPLGIGVIAVSIREAGQPALPATDTAPSTLTDRREHL